MGLERTFKTSKCANSVLLYAVETSVIEGQNQGNGRGVTGSGWFEKYLGS